MPEAPAVWRELQRHDRMRIGDVTIEVLNPPLPDWERQRVRNDDSLVLRLRYGDVEMLLTGDVGAETERALALDGERRASSHPEGRPPRQPHARRRQGFSSATYRRVALISAGRGNPFGHPAPDVVERLRAIGAQSVSNRSRWRGGYRDRRARSLTVRSMRGRAWTMRVWRTPA